MTAAVILGMFVYGGIGYALTERLWYGLDHLSAMIALIFWPILLVITALDAVGDRGERWYWERWGAERNYQRRRRWAAQERRDLERWQQEQARRRDLP